ncbi:MAG: hypothetical protein Q9191_007508 [Dirinaria sp. TL-2023a]
MSLWEEARGQFVRQLQAQNVDRQTIDQFLQDKASSEDAKRSALALQTESDRKYGQVEVAGKTIPKKWIAQIMGNIDKFVKIGDYAMKGAPETVGLAWFAIKQVLNAVQNDFKLYDFFGVALSDITEMMVLIRTYDKLYDDRKTANWTASDIVGELFNQIRNIYAAILDFSYSVKRHIKGGKLAKITHAIKDAFGANLPEFDGKMGTIKTLKVKILESSQGAFQEKTFEKLGGVSSELSNVQGTLSVLADAVKSSVQSSQATQELLDEIKNVARTKVPSHHELALQDFDKNKKILNPWSDLQQALDIYSNREADTCEWIFGLSEYIDWRDSPKSSLLCIQGKDGVGKSTLAASIIKALKSQQAENPDIIVQYLFCDNKARGDSDAGQGSTRLENTLVYQLYELAARSEVDSVLLQRCNEVFKNPKRGKSENAFNSSGRRFERDSRSRKDDMVIDFADGIVGLATVLNKTVYLVIDAIDKVPKAEQSELASDLLDLCGREEITVHLLLLCQSTSEIYRSLNAKSVPDISIGMNNGPDIERIVKGGLDKMPGWSQSEKEEAARSLIEKSASSAHYVVQLALPFLNQPFQRPITNRLKDLPDNMNETYSQHLRQLAPNYLDLLRVAVTWTLCAAGAISVREIMEIYSGIYLASETTDDSYRNADDIKIQAAQLREAGGPFLEVTDNGVYLAVTLQDFYGIERFCFESKNDTFHDCAQEQQICSRCKTSMQSSRALTLSRKHAELDIAITCYDNVSENIGQGEAPTEPANPREIDPGDGTVTDVTTNALNDESSPVAEEAKADDDDVISQDSEDADDQEDNPDQDSEDYDTADQDDWSRYEIARWYHHVRQAEILWTVEERKDNPKWQTLLSELDRFCVSDTRAFEGWKQAYVPSYREVWKPLHFAACYGLVSLAELLLDGGADIMELAPGGYTSLHVASEASDPLDILRLFLDRGGDPNYEPKQAGILPVFHDWLCYGADYHCVSELLKHGASCSLINQYQENVMHYFAYYGSDPKILDLLLDNPIDQNNCADINCEAGDRESPLHKLLSRTNVPLDLLKAFIARGADVNKEDKASEQPLYEAAMYGETDAIKLIIDQVKDIDDTNNYGRTALHAAAWAGHKETVQLLLQQGADINRKDNHERTPLFFACWGSKTRLPSCGLVAELLLEELVSKGYKLNDINSRTKQGRTPLREAAAHGFTKVVDLILDMIDPSDKSYANQRDTSKGRSPLHCAALRGHPNVIASLIKHGADATQRDGIDGNGKTALELCHERWDLLGSKDYEDTISELIDAVPAEAAVNRSLLATAAMYGSVSILEKLLNVKADFNEPDQYGWTPLLLARQFGRDEVVEFLSSRAAHIGFKPSSWTYTYGDDFTSLQDEGRRVVHPGDRRLCLLANHPVPAGLSKFYYEVEILHPDATGLDGDDTEGRSNEQLATPPPETPQSANQQLHPEIAIGFSTVEAKYLQFPGWASNNAPNALSWAYHGDDGCFYTPRNKVTTPINNQAKPFGPGDTIGCGVDFGEGKIYYVKNGKQVEGPTFEGVRGRLFPVVGLSDKIEFVTNFGTDPEKPFKSQVVEQSEKANAPVVPEQTIG